MLNQRNLDLITLIPAVIGIGTSIYTCGLTVVRRRKIAASGRNGIAKETVRRAVRNESTFLFLQVAICATALLGLLVSPFRSSNPEVIHILASRSLITASMSIVLTVSSLADVRSRRKIDHYLDEEEKRKKESPK